MFELVVDEEFCAAHAITLRGQREPVHGHNWRVELCVCGARLDQDGLLCDFHLVQGLLRELLAPWHNRNLNAIDPFQRLNPTAELVAWHIAERVGPHLPQGVEIRSVRVTEAPGCAAVFRPGAQDSPSTVSTADARRHEVSGQPATIAGWSGGSPSGVGRGRS
jgi:6-pyruvoyltetrahydropterin/6-carboxytetrahydropterin synthase